MHTQRLPTTLYAFAIYFFPDLSSDALIVGHLQSQASVSDLNAELDKARAKSGGNARDGSSPANTLRSLLFKLPGGDNAEMEREIESVERIRAEPNQPGGKRPEDMSPQELHAVLWQVLTFRDSGEYSM